MLITVRHKRKSVDDEFSGKAQIKRAKKMSNILDHASMKDEDKKALLVAKVIDQEGEEFVSKQTGEIEKNSKGNHSAACEEFDNIYG